MDSLSLANPISKSLDLRAIFTNKNKNPVFNGKSRAVVMSDMNYTQQVVLAITPKVTALLSVLGSSWIVVEVLTQPSKRNNVYNRLLCAMSFFDIMSSIAIFASTWPIPKEIEGIAFAAGNEKTCIAQGFLIQAGIITPFCKTISPVRTSIILPFTQCWFYVCCR